LFPAGQTGSPGQDPSLGATAQIGDMRLGQVVADRGVHHRLLAEQVVTRAVRGARAWGVMSSFWVERASLPLLTSLQWIRLRDQEHHPHIAPTSRARTAETVLAARRISGWGQLSVNRRYQAARRV
jgi:hypothetical protein